MTHASKTVWLKAFLDEGVPGPEHFDVVDSEVAESDVPEGGVMVQALFMSVDPYLRGGIKSSGGQGDASGRRPMSGFISGKVLASRSDKFEAGDLFGGSLQFATVQIAKPEQVASMWKLTGLVDEAQLSRGVGVMGMPGSTAYAGVKHVLRPAEKPDKPETIFVSAASGAVGSLVGQIASNVYGCRAIGSCGGADKGKVIVDEFGYEAAVDYKALPKDRDAARDALKKQLHEFAPDGIDMYFENVGGVHFEAAVESLGKGGRVAVCGGISQYNTSEPKPERIFPMGMIYTQQRIEGFVCFEYLMGKKGSFLKDMSGWIKDGKVSAIEETFYDGVENWPVAFRSLFDEHSKDNKGKVVVRI